LACAPSGQRASHAHWIDPSARRSGAAPIEQPRLPPRSGSHSPFAPGAVPRGQHWTPLPRPEGHRGASQRRSNPFGVQRRVARPTAKPGADEGASLPDHSHRRSLAEPKIAPPVFVRRGMKSSAKGHECGHVSPRVHRSN
jgi:hypothetical protein